MKTTEIDNTIHSFGRYLQVIRNDKGISLETVSEETKIRQDVLIQIENEDFDKLPGPVFMKGFLKAFANCIGADGNKAVNLYDYRLRVIRKIVKSESDLYKTAKRYWSRMILSCLILFCMIVLSIFTISRLENHLESDIVPQSMEETRDLDNKQAVIVTNPVVSATSDTKNNKVIPEKYQLQIQAVEETWMKITVDGRKAKEYTLNPGDYMELEAQSGFNLVIGNPSGVNMTLNQEPLKIPIYSGEMVNLRIP